MSNNLVLADVFPVLNDLQTKLAGENGAQVFEALKRMLRSQGPKSLTINLDAKPVVPRGSKVQEHQKGGIIQWDLATVSLHQDDDQKKNGARVKGYELRKRIVTLAPYNANVLDFLLKNQHLIPKEWRDKIVCFWGTVYLDEHDDPYVRCLSWFKGAWGPYCFWVNNPTDEAFHALVPAV